MLFTVYLLSRHPFSRRSCEADNSAVPHHPHGHGADGHAMDGLWGRELHQSQRPGGQLSHSNFQKTSSSFQCESALVRMTCAMNHTLLDQVLPVLESGTEVISWYFHDAKAEV